MASASSPSPPHVVLVGDPGVGKSSLVQKLTGEEGKSSDRGSFCPQGSFTREFQVEFKVVPASSPSSPYVVLIGDPGVGKSSTVEKLTGVMRTSSENASFCRQGSVTKESEYFYVPGDKGLCIADTPASHTIKGALRNNIQIASAITFRPVSKIFIVVKADMRIDPAIRSIQKFINKFLDAPEDILAVLVTHMDTVGWEEEKFVKECKKNTEIGQIVFCGIDTPKESLLQDMLSKCRKPYDFCITGDNFFKFFDTCGHQRKYLKYTKEAVDDFKRINRSFHDQLSKFEGNDRIDLHFEFEAFMTAEIDRMKRKMVSVLEFTFTGENAYVEAEYVASMTKQLKAVLFGIRMELRSLQEQITQVGVRTCPYCKEVWMQGEGCHDADTTCGTHPNSGVDSGVGYNAFAPFTFETTPETLIISKIGDRGMKKNVGLDQDGHGFGCGRSINWSTMKRVLHLSTQDIDVLPPKASGTCKNIDEMLHEALASLKESSISLIQNRLSNY